MADKEKSIDPQMADAKNKQVSFEFKSKKTFVLPKGAKIQHKDCRITVEEISNGYLITKSWSISYLDTKNEKHWDYFDEKAYSKANIYAEVIEEGIELADKL